VGATAFGLNAHIKIASLEIPGELGPDRFDIGVGVATSGAELVGGAGRHQSKSDRWAGGMDRSDRVVAAAAALVEQPKGTTRAAFPGPRELGASW
jgi:hypothetical protein